MNSCPYCGQTSTRKDEFGYCKKYLCFSVSGKKEILDGLIRRANNIYTFGKTAQLSITSHVTNYYNPRDREANDIIYECEKQLGFIPTLLIKAIPIENMKKWDKNIRW